MDVTLHQLRVMREVARRASFTRAAEALYVSQPAVSRTIRELERQVGLPLFEQVERRARPTEAGRRLLECAERMLGEVDSAARALAELKDGESGRLEIGASSTPGTYLLPGLLGRFRRDHPRVEAALEIADTHVVLDRVRSGSLDLGVVGEAQFDASLAARLLRRDLLRLILAPDHPLAGRTAVRPPDLAAETLVLRERGSSTREVLERALREAGVRPREVLELGSTEAVKKAVGAGLGVAFVSELAIDLELRAGALVSRPAAGLSLGRGLYAVRRAGFRPTPLQQRFMEALAAFRPGPGE